jgi:hypothetical protein
MNSSTRLALLLGLQLAAGAAFVACGSDSSDKADPNTGTGGGTDAGVKADDDDDTGDLSFVNAPYFSSFVPNHESVVPIQIKDTTLRGMGAKFTSSDTSIATVVDTADGATVTIKKDGKVTIKATLNGMSGSTTVTSKAFTEAQWTTGQGRFSKTDLAIVPKDPTDPVTLLALANGGMLNKTGACTTCHTSQAKTLKIENGPLQTAGYSDDELVTIFTMGKKPDTARTQSMIPAFAWGMFHSWTVTDEEKQGLLAFIRTQTPKPTPNPIDYGVEMCADAGAPMGGIPALCDSTTHKPITIPGLNGPAGGGTDAGTSTTTPDAGTSSSDAGTSTSGDAG